MLESSKTIVVCEYMGYNLDDSTDEEPIVTSQRVRVDVKDGLLMLNITSVLLEDAGEYRILVRNQASEITASCTLNVFENITAATTPPLFTNTIKGREIFKVESIRVHLTCIVAREMRSRLNEHKTCSNV